jgi:uncharacterized membrane protein
LGPESAISKVILESADVSPLRLTELRATGSALVLFGAVAILRPRSLRVSARELAFLAVFGIAGLAFVQLFYFVAIERLEIGIALVIQYLAPVFVALWAALRRARGGSGLRSPSASPASRLSSISPVASRSAASGSARASGPRSPSPPTC